MEHESLSTWLDAHLDGDGRWADAHADVAVLVDDADLTEPDVSADTQPGDDLAVEDGGAWLDAADDLAVFDFEGVEQVVVTDGDLAGVAVSHDADIAVPETELPADSGIVDPFDEFIARTTEPEANLDEASPDPGTAVVDDVAPAPADGHVEPAADTPAPAVAAAEPPPPGAAAPSPAGYDAFDLEPAAPVDDWSVDLSPDHAPDEPDDAADHADDAGDHLDGGDLA